MWGIKSLSLLNSQEIFFPIHAQLSNQPCYVTDATHGTHTRCCCGKGRKYSGFFFWLKGPAGPIHNKTPVWADRITFIMGMGKYLKYE